MGASAIPLQGVPAPITNPMVLQQQAANLADTSQQIQLRQQQVQAAQLENQLTQQTLRDNQTAQSIFTSPDTPIVKSNTPQASIPANVPAAQAQPAAAIPPPGAGNSAMPIAPAATPTPPPVSAGSAAAPPVDPETGETPQMAAAASAAPPPANSAAVLPSLSAAQSPAPVIPPQTSPLTSINAKLGRVWDSDMSYAGKVRVTQQILATQKEIANNANLNAEALAKQNNRYVGLIDGIQSVTDPVQRAAIYQQARAQAVSENLPGAKDLPPTDPGYDALQQQRNIHLLHSDLLTEAKELPKILDDARTSAARTIGTVADSTDPAAAYQTWLKRQDPRIRPELPQDWNQNTLGTIKKLGLNPEQQLRAPEQEALTGKTQLETFEKQRDIVATDLAGATDAASYTRKYDAIKNPDIQKLFPKPEIFDPNKTPKQVLQAGETPTQRSTRETAERQADTAALREKETERRTDEMIRRGDTLQDKADRAAKQAITEAQKTALQKQHSEIEQKKDEKWAQNIEYGDITDRSKIGDTVTDPVTKKDVTLNANNLAYYKAQRDKSAAQAQDLEKQMKQIQTRLNSGSASEDSDNEPPADKRSTAPPPAKTPTPAPTVKPIAAQPKGTAIPGSTFKVGDPITDPKTGKQYTVTGYNSVTKKMTADPIQQ